MDVIVFGTPDCFDSWEHRAALVRIPEVSMKIRQAQQAFDRYSDKPFDLHACFTSETSVYLHNIRLKRAMVALVQSALFERYIRFHSWPKYLVGMEASESVFELIFAQKNLSEFFSNCGLFSRPRHLQVVGGESSDAVPILSGISLPQFQAYALRVTIEGPTGKAFGGPSSQMNTKLDEVMVNDWGSSVIVVGSVSELSRWRFSSGIQVVDSIKMDPILPWYWNGEQVLDMAVAQ